MADKEIMIGDGTNARRIAYGTSIKETPELSDNVTQTFDGPINDGLADIPYTIEMSRVRYDKKETHESISKLIEDMYNNPQTITIYETVRPRGEKPYRVISRHTNCITTGNDYEIDPENKTIENLKFRSEKREREWKDV